MLVLYYNVPAVNTSNDIKQNKFNNYISRNTSIYHRHKLAWLSADSKIYFKDFYKYFIFNEGRSTQQMKLYIFSIGVCAF